MSDFEDSQSGLRQPVFLCKKEYIRIRKGELLRYAKQRIFYERRTAKVLLQLFRIFKK